MALGGTQPAPTSRAMNLRNEARRVGRPRLLRFRPFSSHKGYSVNF
jgi:hypothetical protein